MPEGDRRKSHARWWEILVPVFVLVVGVTAVSRTPLDHAGYALLGVFFVAVISWFSIILLRRCGFLRIFEHLWHGY